MSKKILFFFLLCFSSIVSAQQIPNGGFENWTPGFGYDDPTSWASLNALTILGVPISVSKSTQSHSGSFSAKVETIAADLEGTGEPSPNPGVLFIGSLDVFAQSFVNGMPFTAKPDSLVGWVKYSPVNGDTAAVVAQLTKWNSTSMMQDMIGIGLHVTLSSSAFSRFSVPIQYILDDTPDTLVVNIISSLGNSQVGSAIWVDDLSLIYNDQIQVNELAPISSFDIFPNPVNEELSIKSKITDRLEIYSSTGKLIDSFEINPETISKFDVKLLSNGLYFIKSKSAEIKRFVVQH